jgi:tetratricopeptide (TPR) repeat protein
MTPKRLSVLPYLSCCAVTVTLLTSIGCTPGRFPVVKPAEKIERNQVTKAKAEEYFIRARDMERRGLQREAERLYERAFNLDRNSVELRNLLVRNYMDAGKPMQALLLVKGKKKNSELTTDEKRIVAGIYLKTGTLPAAVEVMESIVDKNETDYYSLAFVCESMENYRKALQYYRAYYRSNAASLELGMKIVRMEMVQKEFAAADSLVAALQEHDGEKAELCDLRGICAMVRKDTAVALDLFNKAIGLDSLYEGALRNAAQVYLQKNDYAGALGYYEKLYRNSVRYKGVFGRTLAMLYYYTKQSDKAAALITALLEELPEDAELHFYLGLSLVAQGKDELARIEFEKAIVLRGDYAEAWRELIYSWVREKNYDRASEVAGRFGTAEPGNSAAWRLTGYVLCLKKEFDHARGSFEKSIALDSTDAGTWFELGSCLERQGDIPRAAEVFRRVLRLNPGDPSALNYLGYMWAEKGIFLDSAKLLLETALSKDPDNGAFLDSYAWVFFQMGNTEKAYEYIEKAVSRIHNDPVVFEHRGDILLKRNDPRGALRAYYLSIEYNPDDAARLRRKIVAIEPCSPSSSNR